AGQTHALGRKIGELLQVGDLVGLTGELGAGKTALVRGIAEGAGVAPEDVSSPTFTIVQTYAGRLPLHHADLYRLSTLDELYATGFFDLLDSGGAALVEWADRVKLDTPMLRVHLSIIDATTRRVELSGDVSLAQKLEQEWVHG